MNDAERKSDSLLRLQSVIDTAIDGIITINDMGIVESVNPAAARMFGYAPEEVIGHNISMLMPSPYHKQHDGYILNYKTTEKKKIIGIGREVLGKKKDKSTFPFRLAVSEIKLKGRSVFTGIIHDLTAMKAAEQRILDLNKELEQKVQQRTDELADTVNKLLLSNKQLQHEIKERRAAETTLRLLLDKEKELNELKSRFVSMASHEFRTPLSSILSSAELIAEYKNTEQQAKRERHVERIRSSIENMTAILNDFLSLSKLEEGIVTMHPQELSIKVFCQDIIDELQGILKPNQSIIHQSDTPDNHLFLDEHFLRNVFFNLMSNASKYSDEGANIYCSTEIKDDYLMFEIRDEGIGIPEEDQEHLFTRFFRARNAENIQGTGLGLHIVKRYLNLLNGTINLTSTLNVGTTVTVKIPLKNKTS